MRYFHLAADRHGNAAGHFVTNEMSFAYREQTASNALRDLLSLTLSIQRMNGLSEVKSSRDHGKMDDKVPSLKLEVTGCESKYLGRLSSDGLETKLDLQLFECSL